MRRGLLALVVGGLVFTAVYAFAASLTLNTGVLQAGGGATVNCDGDGVTATYTFLWNTTSGDYDVDKVTVVGINAACAGLKLEVDLANASGTSLSHVTTTVQGGGGNQEVDVPNTAAVNVAKTQVAIHS